MVTGTIGRFCNQPYLPYWEAYKGLRFSMLVVAPETFLGFYREMVLMLWVWIILNE